ncbi:methanethiol oxidase [Comamonas badia]|uniref:selenium-binding protein SBP56-related protein n=1 Tax=Comamonas badia TaxID=265291 RepID=UPI00040CC60B|nr:selenium-binding protein SBP56-related protein [Comamonas badia]
MTFPRVHTLVHALVIAGLATLGAAAVTSASADETCNSPYTANLIKGQEDFVHVWTLGIKGMGDGNDKLVTIDANPKSKHYGKVIDKISLPGRGEAHHMGFSDDRRYLWGGRLDDNKIFVFDLINPAKPKLIKTIANIESKTGFVGPHTFYAMPGRMLVQALSNNKDHGGQTGLVMFNNKGDIVDSYPMPTTEIGGVKGDGYGYDIAIDPGKNVMLTSSFTGWNNYMMDLGKMVKDPDAMKQFGNTMAVWDVKSMKPTQVLSVPGAPLEIRWSLNPNDHWAVTATALTSKIWLIKQDASGQWVAKDVADIGDPSKVPLPVDISITADGKGLWVNTFLDGKTRYFDMTDPEHPKETYSITTGPQVNMVSQSWDGKRVYLTSSLLANWDKKGKDNEQVLRAFDWDGQKLTEKFEVDFAALKLGRAHHMKFSARPAGKTLADLGNLSVAQAPQQ